MLCAYDLPHRRSRQRSRGYLPYFPLLLLEQILPPRLPPKPYLDVAWTGLVCYIYWHAQETGLSVDLVGAIGGCPSQAEVFVDVYNARSVADWVGLGHSISWFT